MLIDLGRMGRHCELLTVFQASAPEFQAWCDINSLCGEVKVLSRPKCSFVHVYHDDF